MGRGLGRDLCRKWKQEIGSLALDGNVESKYGAGVLGIRLSQDMELLYLEIHENVLPVLPGSPGCPSGGGLWQQNESPSAEECSPGVPIHCLSCSHVVCVGG